jgi:hypothetical protein
LPNGGSGASPAPPVVHIQDSDSDDAVMIYADDAVNSRGLLINEEARIQRVMWQLNFVQYTEHIQHSEYNVHAEMQQQSSILQSLEQTIENNEGRASAAEARLMDSEMQRARALHAEHDALAYAAAEHHQAEHHARHVFVLAGIPEDLEARLEQDQLHVVRQLGAIASQGRAEILAWQTFV